MIRPLTAASLLLCLVSLPGCVTGPGTGALLPVGDPEVFAAEVQPVLAAGCSNPSCHGNAGRPLEVYAPFMHRLDPDRVHLDEPITEAELVLNRLRAAAFLRDCDDPDLSALLTKPLAPAAGGCEHTGGTVYEDDSEPDYQTLRAWASEAIDEAGRSQ